MSKLFEPLPLAPEPVKEKTPLESFESMEEEASAVDEPLGGILPCEKPRVEVWLADAEGVAVSSVDTSLRLGGGHDGRLDGQGYLKLEDVEIPEGETEEFFAELTVDEGGKHQLQFVQGPPPKEEDAEEPTPEVTEEQLEYAKPRMDEY